MTNKEDKNKVEDDKVSAKEKPKAAPKAKAEKKEKSEAKVDKKAAKKDDAKKKAKKSKKAAVGDYGLYDIIVRPVITEKSTMALEHNKVTFKVDVNATKPRIKQAVEQLFGVTVIGVNTINTKGKVKRFRGMIGKRNDVKKAIVTLKEGDTIDFAAGVK